MEDTARCLTELGFQLSAPPSRSMLVDAAMRRDLSLWNPFSEAILSGSQPTSLTWDEIRSSCNVREFVEFTN